MSGPEERKVVMRTANPRLLLVLLVAAGGCAGRGGVSQGDLVPRLPVYRLAILVRQVAGQCRTTTIPALAVVNTTQTVTWEVISVDRNACRPGDVQIALKATSRAAGKDGAFSPVRDERVETWSVRGLQTGRYQYDVKIGNYIEDPELEVWR
jgi:hypothetical protein